MTRAASYMGVVAAMTAFASLQSASAQYAPPIQWKESEGGNGHWYSASTSTASWPGARGAAESVGAMLACTETAAEAEFLRSAGLTNELFVFVGLYQDFKDPNYVEPAGGWRWLSGEPFDATLWQPGEPNDLFGGEGYGELEGPGRPPYLNDVIQGANLTYYLEWSSDCNGDGIVDLGQIRAGQLPDFDGDNVPDCCVAGGSCEIGSYPVQWKTSEGGNGNWYAVLPLPSTDRESAVAFAAARGGVLASIEDSAEGETIVALTGGMGVWERLWIGLSQSQKGAEPAGGWAWDDGTPLNYTNWFPGQPDDSFGEDFAHMFPLANPASGQWNDVDASGPGGVAFYVAIEWSSDCNGDGIVDYGQILNGQLADADANGVPDVCESTLNVPSQFATIQAAIDSVPTGVARTILVAAGTYNESFALNGKNVVVRGAPKGGTILDGAGLATSIARFSGGEPATAGVEDLVFRNGAVGSRIFPKATFRVGGALYGSNSSAFVRDCRFEDNESDFGGAVYLYRSTGVVAGCEFVSNLARSEGGAMQWFESSGAVSDSTFTGNVASQFGAGAASAFKAVGARTEGGVVLLDGCTIEAGIGGSGASAVEMFEIAGPGGVRGTLRISGTTISGNSALVGAGGLRVVGMPDACVLTGGTVICGNTPRNVLGPFLIEGSAQVCDCLSDVTLDGAVNGADLGVVLAAWGAVSPTGAGDANHDGFVDGADLAQVLASWGSCP